MWERLPDELEPPDYELRRGFALEGVEPGDRVLDLGCGEGTFTKVLGDVAPTVVGADVARAALERARRRHPGLDFRLIRIEEPLPFDDCAFDLVWASEVIEHVADTATWLSELRRVLRPGGRLLLTTPDHPRVALLLHGVERFSEPLGDHLHLYTKRSLSSTLAEFAFEHVHIRRAGGPPLFRRMLLARATRP